VGRSMRTSEVGRGVEAERGQTAFFGAMTVDCPRAPVLRPLVLRACLLVIGAGGVGCDRGRSGSTTTPEHGSSAAAPQGVAQPANDGAVAKASVVADAPACGALTAMDRSKPLPLLADRLRVRSVKGAEDNPVPWDVMGAPDAATDRSRIYVETGEHGLAIVGSEMYQRAGRDFVAQAAKELAMPGGEVMQVDTGNAGLVLVAWLPTEAPHASREVIPVSAASGLRRRDERADPDGSTRLRRRTGPVQPRSRARPDFELEQALFSLEVVRDLTSTSNRPCSASKSCAA
jgi:hypothetical protein